MASDESRLATWDVVLAAIEAGRVPGLRAIARAIEGGQEMPVVVQRAIAKLITRGV